MGKAINAMNSENQTVRYDDGLKFSIIFLIVGILYIICYFFSIIYYTI